MSSKFLDFKNFHKICCMMAIKEHLSDLGKAKIIQIKSKMNNSRTEFSWIHLKNFYN